MLGALTLLLVFQLAGEAIALYFALPIPGPVIGIIAMGVAERLGSACDDLLSTGKTLCGKV